MTKKEKSEAIIVGVCSGLSNLTGIDVKVIRIIFIVLSLLGGLGIVLYLIGVVIIFFKNSNPTPQDIYEAKRKAENAEMQYRQAVENAKKPGGRLYSAQSELDKANAEGERIKEALDKDYEDQK